MNPVMASLTQKRVNELRQANDAVAREVHALLGTVSPPECPSIFVAWCQRRRVLALPAKPEAVALFLIESKELGIDALCVLAEQISAAHAKFADPTASWVVSKALESIGGFIAAPRSWLKGKQQVFAALPFSMQRVVAEHEARRETVLRRAQNEAATLRNQFKKLEKKNAETTTTTDAA
jgi:hypothetical protein